MSKQPEKPTRTLTEVIELLQQCLQHQQWAQDVASFTGMDAHAAENIALRSGIELAAEQLQEHVGYQRAVEDVVKRRLQVLPIIRRRRTELGWPDDC